MLRRKRDQVPAGSGAGEADRGGGDIRTVLGELDHLRARDQLDQLLGEFELDRRGAGEVRAVADRLGDGFHHPGIGMAQDHRSQPHPPVDELAAVRIPYPAPFPTDDEAGGVGGELIVALAVGVGAAGNSASRALSQAELLGRRHRPRV